MSVAAGDGIASAAAGRKPASGLFGSVTTNQGGIRDVRHRIVVAFGALSLGSAVLHLTPAQAYQLDTVNLIGCAQDGGVCRMPYPTNVYYGVPGRTNGRPFPQGGMVPCNTQTFGDPAPGQAKSCWYAPRITAGGGTDRRRIDEDDEPRRDTYRYGRDYDRPPARRPYDEDYGPARRRYRDDPDED
jgi:hypothetical protein